MRSRLLLAVPVLGLLGLLLASAHGVPATAQEAPPANDPAADTSDAERGATLAIRGAATWRRYVWTLERPLLVQIVRDLDEAGRLMDGRLNATQWFQLSYSHLALGNVDIGKRALADARRVDAEMIGVFLLDGLVHILDGDLPGDEQEQVFDELLAAVAKAPADLELRPELEYLGHLHLGSRLHVLGKGDLAITHLERAAAIARDHDQPPSPGLIQRLALAHQSVNQMEQAEELVGNLIREDPGNPFHYYNMGLLFGSQERFDEARIWYRRALERKGDYADAHAKLAFIARKEGRLSTARKHLDAVARLQEGSTDADVRADVESGYGAYFRSMAESLEAEGREADARVHYERSYAAFLRALDARPGCGRALNGAVQVGFRLDRPEDELEVFRSRLRAIRENAPDAPRSLVSTFC